MSEEKLDAIIKIMSAIHSDVTELKQHTVKTDKKFDRIIKHAIKSDERSERLEKQLLAIGIELKEENKVLDRRVTSLEKEVFPELMH